MMYNNSKGEDMALGRKSTRKNFNWLGIVPFLLFCLIFEIVPIIMLIRGSIIDKQTLKLTAAHYKDLLHPLYINSFWNSIKLSGLTAILGTIIGTLVGYAIYRWPSNRMREILITLSDVTTNFAGAPLAFAFVVILGMNGVITQFLLKYAH